jgi:hypothetical protein
MKQIYLLLLSCLAFSLPALAQTTWTGATSTAWNTASNWNTGTVPTASNDVVIPDVINDPVISAAGALANSVQVHVGGMLTIQNSASLTINGSRGGIGDGLPAAFANSGTVNNSGQLTIGNLAAVGDFALFNKAIFNNNTGGQIRIDRSMSVGLYNQLGGNFTNAAAITIGAVAAVGAHGLRNHATFKNNTGGQITIDRSTEVGLYNTAGNFINASSIVIGGTASVGLNGLQNFAVFYNTTGGQLTINRSTDVGLNNQNGIIQNEASIVIGGTAAVGKWGLQNFSLFFNNAGGQLTIDRSAEVGLFNSIGGLYNSAGTFTNASSIVIGGTASVGIYGLQNSATFNNNTGGQITINRSTDDGLYNNAGTFTNASSIVIGSTAAVGVGGLVNGAVFNNNTGGSIQIDRSLNVGLYNIGGIFTNASSIVISGSSASPVFQGVANISTINNSPCATLTFVGRLFNIGSFSNVGLMTVTTLQAHTNNGFVNDGIIAYPQGNPIPNVTNNKLIVTPITTACGPITPALQLGAANNLVVGATWYKDAALNTIAGNYTPNTFTPTNLAAGGPYTVYFTVADPVNGCTRTVSISVTVNGTAGTWYLDADKDGHYLSTVTACFSPGIDYNNTGGTLGDCNDNNPAVWQSASLYIDADGDGYDAGQAPVCYGQTVPSGYSLTTKGTDCNDNNVAVFTNNSFYVDGDGDGYGKGSLQPVCYNGTGTPTGYSTNNTDCDDGNKDVWQSSLLYIDADGDGYDAGTATVCYGNTIPLGYKTTTLGTDCNDGNVAIFTKVLYFIDADMDGYGSSATEMLCALTAPAGYATRAGDCNDNSSAINPGVLEICGNNIDDNCNGLVDENCMVACDNATAFTTTNITVSSAQLNWTAIANPDQWQVRYKTTNLGSKWIDVFVSGDKRTVRISPLLANQNYIWQIRATCGTTWTEYSGANKFETLAAALLVSTRQAQAIKTNATIHEGKAIQLYPNPSTGRFQLLVRLSKSVNANAKIELFSKLGQALFTSSAFVSNGILQTTVQLPVTVPSGMYVVKITTANEVQQTKLVYSKN